MIKTFILASALSLFMAGNAAEYSVNHAGIDYEMITITGTYDELSSWLTVQPQCRVDVGRFAQVVAWGAAELFYEEDWNGPYGYSL
jgi:hypothetical protein